MAGQHRKNNFDALRFWSALAVLWSHSFPLSGQHDPIGLLTAWQTTGGGLAVAAFFVISGYLVTASYCRSPDPLRFIRARALRIFPALVVVLLISALIAGPLLTTLTLSEYFSSPLTYRHVYRNLPVFFDNAFQLPGVFAKTVYPKAVNGSLWTLPYEFRCYLLVLVLGILGLLGRAACLILFAAAMIAIILLKHDNGIAWNTAFLSGAFLAGSILFLFDTRARPTLMGTALAAVVTSACLKWQLPIVLASVGAYFIVCLGLSSQIRIPYLSRLAICPTASTCTPSRFSKLSRKLSDRGRPGISTLVSRRRLSWASRHCRGATSKRLLFPASRIPGPPSSGPPHRARL